MNFRAFEASYTANLNC